MTSSNFSVRRHNPVAADIDVTDNCFCSVFFAGLYLSSSFNNSHKTALIFHENNEVFVNCEIGCKNTSVFNYFALLAWEWFYKMPADLKASNQQEIPNKREVKSRKNTPEEKRKQNREWRKRK